MIRLLPMTAIDPDLRAISTTCAYCGVGCGVLATPDGAALRFQAIPNIQPISAGCARRDRRWARRLV
jgi:predicted molibdopterin-dependent oxidoreductase YjgC